METTYWTNDDGPPRFLFRKQPGEVMTYEDGTWHDNYAISRKIFNGDGVDLVSEEEALAVQKVLDELDRGRFVGLLPMAGRETSRAGHQWPALLLFWRDWKVTGPRRPA